MHYFLTLRRDPVTVSPQSGNQYLTKFQFLKKFLSSSLLRGVPKLKTTNLWLDQFFFPSSLDRLKEQKEKNDCRKKNNFQQSTDFIWIRTFSFYISFSVFVFFLIQNGPLFKKCLYKAWSTLKCLFQYIAKTNK